MSIQNIPEEEIDKMSFESALERLEKIVQELEKGDIQIEDMVNYYSEGKKLKEYCESKLKKASMKIEKIISSEEEEKVKVEKFDVLS